MHKVLGSFLSSGKKLYQEWSWVQDQYELYDETPILPGLQSEKYIKEAK